MLYPISTESRQLIDLSGIWQFRFEMGTEWQPIAVPASFNDQQVLSEYKNYVGDFFYQTDIFVTKAMLNERLFLRFDSVTHFAEVYLNDRFIGSHKGGFTPFEFEITEFVQQGKNLLTVKANNILDNSTLPVGNYSEKQDENGNLVKKVDENFDFFNYAGIHRPVKLWTKPYNYIDDLTITYDFVGEDVSVNIAIQSVGSAENFTISVYDEQQQLVAQSEGAEKTQRFTISNVKRWQPLNAYLYDIKIELINLGEVQDCYCLPVGFRSIEIKDNQFLINGNAFYFKGYGKHEDSHFAGRGLNSAVNVLDFNIMKWQGANSFRTSHYPYSEEIMRLADREGFVVIDETTAVGLMHNFGVNLFQDASQQINTWEKYQTTEAHQQVIRELIERDKNYACVVMWSIANEPSTAEQGAYEYFKPLFELARSLDPQKRPCTFVNIMLAPAGKDLAMSLCDVICLNRYYGWYVNTADLTTAKNQLRSEIERWHQLFPTKPIMFTEYGVDTIAGLHDMDFNTPFTEEFQIEYYQANHEVMDSFDYFIGEQVWNFADFQTKYGIFRVQGNKKGLFTRTREPKMAAHYFKQRWQAIPDFGYKTKD
ncbi:beta-glucuronidase [Rodentibacter haemolyticus]|uniref:Beta-glucuronidase n=1 Tax=Rodentibacter haemolyticus TaxID=2778911 RepID=A0ABX6V0L5_9PAST|nr:beta-glucuronidase [Rodentibacter haemolyticus]QPB43579.1 beta-glucuronidase [Rodentibacter haemolyticus]